jgi:2-C-methyl-D-erythritol 2,4-cyclodiphosphate synthase
VKVGLGFDVHRLVPGRPLVLGGVEVPHSRGLEGHSDADVLAHAVGDAILGALGAGDLGTYFPSSDPRWENATGERLLAEILDRVADAGLRVDHVDGTIVAEEPRLAPVREEIEKGLARILRVEPSRVNVKLKTTDRLGSIGNGEGIAALAVAVLSREEK